MFNLLRKRPKPRITRYATTGFTAVYLEERELWEVRERPSGHSFHANSLEQAIEQTEANRR